MGVIFSFIYRKPEETKELIIREDYNIIRPRMTFFDYLAIMHRAVNDPIYSDGTPEEYTDAWYDDEFSD